MPKRIDKLTSEQESRMESWAQEWISRGLCTDEADWETFESNAQKCYELSGLKWHGLVIRVGSPLAVAVTVPTLAATIGKGSQVGAQVRDQVWDQVRSQVGSQVWDQVRSQVGAQVRDQVWAQVGAQVRDQVRSQVGDQVGDQVRSQVRDQVRDQVGDQVWDQVGSQVGAQVRDQVGDQWNLYIGGSFLAYWHAYTSFFREVCGLELKGDMWERDRAFELAQMSAGWWWPHTHFVVVGDRPQEIHREQVAPSGWGSHRLHNETGPAISYRDGWKLYFLEGVNVSSAVVERPDTITIEDIRNASNAEVRRVTMQQYGLLRYFKDLGAKELDSRFGEALFRDPEDDQKWLVCTDGSTGRIYQLRVPVEVESVRQAQIALNGVDPELMLARS